MGSPSRARTPSGVSGSWMPCCRPWVLISAAEVCSPDASIQYGAWVSGSPSQPASSGWSNEITTVAAGAGSPWWTARGSSTWW